MNVTFSLDDELVGAAKSVAARHGTSVTALVRSALEHQVAVEADLSASGASGVMQALIDYSLGRIPRAMAMQALGLDDYGALLSMLNAAHLPHPLVPLSTRQKMAAQMVAVLKATEPGT
ncbi:hypothetical protein [Roseateles sp.]|uniref:hypothetical protein n=1 Tax=Roseateles sp. TaxID=1971397 RepID=UPI0025D9732A|nr:hypothetical protein [Roseateles sp.]MBV8035791.1 hypothetical protein [Roseateles sp.]